MKALLFALRLFRRDWRSGELRLLSLALTLAVAAVTTTGFFTNRIERTMEIQAAELLAADLVISSNNPIPRRFTTQAQALHMRIARSLSFPSVILHGDRTQLVEVKAVSPEYPLRGELRTRPNMGSADRPTPHPPRPGTLWVGPRLLAALGIDSGAKLSLGEKNFQVAAVLSRDTGEAGNLFRLGPRVLMALSDIPATGLVTAASRVHHHLLLAGGHEAVAQYRQWALDNLPPGARLEHMGNARPELRSALDRGRRFLALAALAAVLVAGAAVALSTRQFVDNQSDTSAIMRCLGATRGFILRILLMRLLLIALSSSMLGSLLGYLAQMVLASLMGEWFSSELPPPDLSPLALGLGTGLITLVGFTLAPLLRLGSVPPLRVLRRDLGATPPGFWLVGLLAFAAMGLLILWAADDVRLALLITAAAMFTLGLLLISARLLVWLLSPLRQQGGAIWCYGLAGLARNPAMTAIQLTGFGLGILALLLLAIVRVDLITSWEHTIPPQAPNQFLINIQPQEVAGLKRFMAQQNIPLAGIYPMLRARLTRINGRPVSAEHYQDARAKRLVNREFNLSWTHQLPPGNAIIAGSWWHGEQQQEALFSVEQGIADTLGIKLGDRLQFNLAGVDIEARVSSLRSVKWDSFRPNFFVIGTPGLLQRHPTNYITSFHLAPGRETLIPELVKQFPAITIIDVGSLMDHVREIMERGALAVEYVFLFTLVAGLLVLYAGVQASREGRRQESAILRTLGLKRKQLLWAVGVEFVMLGLLAGLLASICASLAGWFISREILQLSYSFNPWLWLLGTFGGALSIGVAGVMATYPLVIRPPLQTLRER